MIWVLLLLVELPLLLMQQMALLQGSHTTPVQGPRKPNYWSNSHVALDGIVELGVVVIFHM